MFIDKYYRVLVWVFWEANTKSGQYARSSLEEMPVWEKVGRLPGKAWSSHQTTMQVWPLEGREREGWEEAFWFGKAIRESWNQS